MIVFEALAIALTLVLVVFAYRVVAELDAFAEEDAQVIVLREAIDPVDLAG